jgi:hypothetical protein
MERKDLKMFTVSLCLMVLTLAGTGVYAQEASPGESKWEFIVTPYFWMVGIDGDVSAKGKKADVNVNFGDIVKDLDFGGEVHMEAWKGRWGILLDPTFLKLSEDGEFMSPALGPVDVDVEVQEWLVDLGGFYQLGKWPVKKDGEQMISLEALGGGRYWYVKTKLDLEVPLAGFERKVEKSKDWIDPFIGLRLRADLTKRFSFVLRGDIGGFGVGSEFTWNTSAVLGYGVSRVVGLWLGYRALGVDYESGSGANKFEFDAIMHGPIAGVSFYF